MKRALLAIAILGTLTASAQTDTARPHIDTKLSVGTSFTMGKDYVVFWGDGVRNQQNWMDSGRIEIMGDTLKVIRNLSRLLDSAYGRLYRLCELADKAIETTANAERDDKSMKRFRDAVGRYFHFAYDRPKAAQKK